MSISPIGQNSPITRLQGSKANGITQGTQDAGRGVTDTDTVEISDSARYLSELKNLPDRTDKVQSAKDAIANGTFETPERINGTVDRLLEALNSF
jgi:anti-sigma28 factor (negative regulator of flagellin synthesis)